VQFIISLNPTDSKTWVGEPDCSALQILKSTIQHDLKPISSTPNSHSLSSPTVLHSSKLEYLTMKFFWRVMKHHLICWTDDHLNMGPIRPNNTIRQFLNDFCEIFLWHQQILMGHMYSILTADVSEYGKSTKVTDKHQCECHTAAPVRTGWRRARTSVCLPLCVCLCVGRGEGGYGLILRWIAFLFCTNHVWNVVLLESAEENSVVNSKHNRHP
jgi:hypothetical protein